MALLTERSPSRTLSWGLLVEFFGMVLDRARRVWRWREDS
jgi:hypothetical protein